MKLFQVRKGQFVYYHNELHRIYSVKPMYRQSIHLVRLRDLEQHLAKAGEIERYRPKHLDSFVFDRKRYTLLDGKKAGSGDYILITKPDPDYLDHYFLNEIEKVASVEDNGVITNRSNGIKHSEYMLMEPGRQEGGTPIDYQDRKETDDMDIDEEGAAEADGESEPHIGDVYAKNNSDPATEAMVVATRDGTVFLGDGRKLPREELTDSEKWTFVYHIAEK